METLHVRRSDWCLGADGSAARSARRAAKRATEELMREEIEMAGWLIVSVGAELQLCSAGLPCCCAEANRGMARGEARQRCLAVRRIVRLLL